MNVKRIAVIAALVLVGTLVGVAVAGYRDAQEAATTPAA